MLTMVCKALDDPEPKSMLGFLRKAHPRWDFPVLVVKVSVTRDALVSSDLAGTKS